MGARKKVLITGATGMVGAKFYLQAVPKLIPPA